ncbi:50S ribosomal protein L19 [bacterium]|nr:50S ribosomal protein L19 [bacterium]
MQIELLQKPQLKAKLPEIKPGDTVRVHQLIREGNKTRTQVFEGLVIRYRKANTGNAFLTVRKIASGVGVEKSWFVHSPNVQKIEVMRRSKVRRAFLSYMRGLRGKAARLTEQDFDKAAANEADHRTADELAALEAEEKAAAEPEVVASTEDIAAQENKEAAQADAASDANSNDDEQQLAAEETQAGVDQAEAETDKKQDKATA